MTLKSTIEGHATSVFLDTDAFAESIVRRPRGRESGKDTQEAIVEIDPGEIRVAGRAELFDAQADVASSESVHRDDIYEIRSELYRVAYIGKPDTGIRSVYLTQEKGGAI